LLRAVFGGLGRLCAVFASPVQARVLCLFATPDIGGAERVHAEIVRAVADAKPQVWFTEVPRDGGLLPLYAAHATLVQLGARLRCRLCAYFQAGLQAGRIRKGSVRVVLGAFSHFFYDMLPWLKGVRCVDLVHNFGVNFENYSLPHLAALHRRVLITDELRNQVLELYAQHGVESAMGERLAVITNGVTVPTLPPVKDSGALRVLYSGRGTPEKRVHLVGQIAHRLAEQAINATVTVMGGVGEAIDPRDAAHCRLTGLVTDPAQLEAEYAAAHVLLITSDREGFPVAVMEAMARGTVPVCTRVGGLVALPNGQCCVLVDSMPEAAVVDQIVSTLRELDADRTRLGALSAAAYRYAREHFDVSHFDAKWRGLLLQEPA